MITRNPLVRRIARHRALSVLFRPSTGLGSGWAVNLQTQNQALSGLPESQVQAALLDPSNPLPSGQVVDPWAVSRGGYGGIQATPTPTIPAGLQSPSLSESQGIPHRPSPKADDAAHPTAREESSSGAGFDPEATLPAETPIGPLSDSNSLAAEEEPKTDQASWRRLEAIYHRHATSRSTEAEDRDDTTQLLETDISASQPDRQTPGRAASPIKKAEKASSISDQTSSQEMGTAPEAITSGGELDLDPGELDRKQKKPETPASASNSETRIDTQEESDSGETTLIARRQVTDQTKPVEISPAGREFSSDLSDYLAPTLEPPVTDPAGESSRAADMQEPSPAAPSEVDADPRGLTSTLGEDLDKQPLKPDSEDTSAQSSKIPPVPLEAVWPVQRQSGQQSAQDRSKQGFTDPEVPAGAVTVQSAEDPQAASIPQAPKPDEATESKIEVLQPSRPPPNFPRGPAGRAEGTTQAQRTSKGEVPVINNELNETRGTHIPSEQVGTEIGPLPADLWALIGKTAPGSRQRQPERMDQTLPDQPTKPTEADPIHQAIREAEKPARQGTSIGRVIEPEPVPMPIMPAPQQSPIVDRFVPPVQRAAVTETETQAPEETGSEAQEEVDIDALARRVYPEIRRRLAIDWERTRRGS